MRILTVLPAALLLLVLTLEACTAPPAAPTTIPSPAGGPGGIPTKPVPTPSIEIPPPIY